MTARGRPSYVPTDKDRRVVEMMSGWAIPEAKIAKVLTIDPKTLRKHFATELDVGHAKLEAQLAQNLLRIAQGHDRQSLIATIFALKSRFGWVEQQPPAREQPLGKKEARMEAAHRAVNGSSKFAPSRPPPYYRHVRAPDDELELDKYSNAGKFDFAKDNAGRSAEKVSTRADG